MGFRHLIICATLMAFAPAALAFMPDSAHAAQTVQKKKKLVQKQAEPRVKKNFRGPRPGEPNAGWTDDCLFYYQVYGRTPPICGKYGRSFMTWDR
ncbi:MAG: hypothetical protein E6G89_05360 [Alphaproteobacteria bacterium]|nr:MAG: hypothetical protein E6G87_05395 [Alphaproteobacteria bacterium]TMJ41845.1 MAG: hypothetical protein E6G89_05360 [Alphaproteobacteria bacterium]